MSASRRLHRSVSRSTAVRSAVAITAAAGLTSVALVAPAAAVPASLARVAAAPFTGTHDEASSPVTVDVSYELDGKKVTAEEVVGKTGMLEVSYLVRNRTTQPTELRYRDGKGEEVVETVDLVAPYVGRLAVALPARSGDVKAEGAEVLQDTLAWSLVLFNPIGEPAQKLRLSMRVADAELPQAQLQVAKVSPTDGGVLAKGIAAAEESSSGSTRLTEGVFKIDSSVLKLRDGASQLFDGLVQLADGAGKLNDGLAGKAAAGAQKLSGGLGKAREGGAKLDDGVGQLSDGSVKLRDGLNAANTGGKALSEGLDKLSAGGGRLVAGLDSAAAGGGKLAEGLRSTSGQPDLTSGTAQVAAGLTGLEGGLTKLSEGINALPQNPGVAQLKAGLDAIIGGIGSPTTDPSLLNGLTQLRLGLDNPTFIGGKPGVKQGLEASISGLGAASGGLESVLAGLNNASATAPGIKQGLQNLQAVLECDTAAAPSACAQVPDMTLIPTPSGDVPRSVLVQQTLVKLVAGLGASNDDPSTPNGTVIDGLTDIKAGLDNARTNTTTGIPALVAGIGQTPAPGTLQTDVLPTLLGGLYLVELGLNNPSAVGGKPGLAQGASQVKGGIDLLVAGIVTNLNGALGTPTTDPKTTLRGGAAALGAGAGTLAEKTALAADGAAQLRGGLDQLAAGGGQLSDGAGTASAGSKKLSAGLDQLAAGGGRLVAGLDAANAGTGKLLDGLVQLDDGGKTLATGLGDAADGSGRIEDGILKVKDGVEAVRDGSGELSGRGTSALGGSVNSAARANAQKVAMLLAIGEMSADSSKAPSFDVVLAGSAAEEDGMSTTAVVGAAAALALLTMAAAGAVVARRRNVI